MHHVIDPATPRHQLLFEELPRGFVPWPQPVVDFLESQEAKSRWGRFADDYRQSTLTRNTLRYYYEDYHVAYRPAKGGVEVLGVGWPEIESFMKESTCKVIQA